MFRHFFAAPDFLAMLRFWEASRAASGHAVWGGELAKVPAALLPNLIVVDWLGTPRYRYVGSECAARFGRDPIGEALPTTLGGAYAAYIVSLGDEVIARRQPIFSTSVFEVGDELMVSGRLFTPFSDAADKPPGIIVSAHLFSRTSFKLNAVGSTGFVNESRRMLIPGVPELCAQLEAAQRYHRVSHAVAGRAQSAEWAEAARQLSRDALIALQPFRVAIG